MPATRCTTRRTCKRVGIVAQRIETSLHAGTHFDGAMHATDGRTGDMASLPLDFLVNQGVVVDLSPQVTDWSAITPEMIEKAGADIREGDILILHTGWHKYYEGPEPAGSGALFLLPPRAELRHARMDAEKEDQMVRHGYRLLRPSDEHLDPHYAARHRARIRTGDGQEAGGLFRHLRIRAQALRTKGPPATCSRFTITRSRKDCCTPRIWAAIWKACSASAASSAPFPGAMKVWNPVRAASWRSSTPATRRSKRSAMRRARIVRR